MATVKGIGSEIRFKLIFFFKQHGLLATTSGYSRSETRLLRFHRASTASVKGEHRNRRGT